MKHLKNSGKQAIVLVLSLVYFPASVCQGGLIVHGEPARAQFEQWLAVLDDHYIDFEDESIAPGPIDPIELEGVTVSFVTTQVRYPSIMEVTYPVSVIPYGFVGSTNSGSRSLMGCGSAGGSPDGQALYEIVFSEPQGRVGLRRCWNTNSITRFFNADGQLLGEHQNTAAQEFVGWLAGGPDPADWVSVVEIDGLPDNGTFQVGEVDDLFFGTEKPPEFIGLVYGPVAEEMFTQFLEVFDDSLVDFESASNGGITTLEIPDTGEVLTFATTERRYPPPTISVSGWPAVVWVPGSGRTRELIGSGSPGGSADGQNPYFIEFPSPQQRVGMWRRWNANSLTRFYAEDGTLLAEHQNTENWQYVGWVGDPEAEATWVRKVVMDGNWDGVAYQVGCTDDLQFSRDLGDKPMVEITRMELGSGNQVHLEWDPLLINPYLQYSPDMINWMPAGGTAGYGEWDGTIEGLGSSIFLRIHAEDPFKPHSGPQ